MPFHRMPLELRLCPTRHMGVCSRGRRGWTDVVVACAIPEGENAGAIDFPRSVRFQLVCLPLIALLITPDTVCAGSQFRAFCPLLPTISAPDRRPTRAH